MSWTRSYIKETPGDRCAQYCTIQYSLHVPDLRQRRAPEDAPHLDLLAAVGDVVLPGDVLLHGLVLVLQTRARPRLDNLHTRGLVSSQDTSS